MFQESESDKSMDEDSLVNQTLELAKLVRNGILYLLQFIYIEETKNKERIETRQFIPTIFAQEVPDHLKSFR